MGRNNIPALIAEGIHKNFGSLEVLKGVSVTANNGDIISIIGSSGSGKSTFLRCINFLETPNSGRIVVGGEEIRVKTDSSGPSLKRSAFGSCCRKHGFARSSH